MSSRPGVIIVNFNSGQFLKRCLKSLYASHLPLSIVVVDNNSADQSIESIKHLDTDIHQLEIVLNDANLGFSRAVNVGRSKLDCEFLALLNPDCKVHPHSIKKLCDVLQQHPDAGIVGALVFNEDGTEQRGCRRNEPTLGRSIVTALGLSNHFEGVDLTERPMPEHPVTVGAVSGSAMMLRTQFMDEVGGMDESYFLHCEDLDICRKMRDAGHTVLFEPGVSVFHRQGGSSGTSYTKVEKLKHQGMMNYYLKYYRKHVLVRVLVAPLLVWSHYVTVILRSKLNSFFHGKHGQETNPEPALNFSCPNVLVSGATTDVGDFLLNELSQSEKGIIALSRSSANRARIQNVRWLSSSYFSKAPIDDHPQIAKWIHLAPIWTASVFEDVFRGQPPKRIIALSSTSAEVKSGSEHPNESLVAQQLLDGELWIEQYAYKVGADYTVLRPTMIYGGPRNRNINLVKRVIMLLGVFPLVGAGSGLRQPVHARDVASACIRLIDQDVTGTRYNIGGNEVLSYKEMLERVFTSLGRRPRFISLSRSLARTILIMLSKVPGLRMLTPQVADRMSVDQIFSIDDAVRDFGFSPGDFNP
ncbi:MAG: glycosyltransferase [Arenicellales bacterium]